MDPHGHVYSRLYCIDNMQYFTVFAKWQNCPSMCIPESIPVGWCLVAIIKWLQVFVLACDSFASGSMEKCYNFSLTLPHLPPPLSTLIRGTRFDNSLHVLPLTPKQLPWWGGGKLWDAFCARDRGRIGFEAVTIRSSRCGSISTLVLAKL